MTDSGFMVTGVMLVLLFIGLSQALEGAKMVGFNCEGKAVMTALEEDQFPNCSAIYRVAR